MEGYEELLQGDLRRKVDYRGTSFLSNTEAKKWPDTS